MGCRCGVSGHPDTQKPGKPFSGRLVAVMGSPIDGERDSPSDGKKRERRNDKADELDLGHGAGLGALNVARRPAQGRIPSSMQKKLQGDPGEQG